MAILMLRKIGLPNLKLDTEKPVENVIRAIILTLITNAKYCQITVKLQILKVSVHNVLANTNWKTDNVLTIKASSGKPKMITALSMGILMWIKSGKLFTLQATEEHVELVMSVTILMQIMFVKGYLLIVLQLTPMETVQTASLDVGLLEQNAYANDLFNWVKVA